MWWEGRGTSVSDARKRTRGAANERPHSLSSKNSVDSCEVDTRHIISINHLFWVSSVSTFGVSLFLPLSFKSETGKKLRLATHCAIFSHPRRKINIVEKKVANVLARKRWSCVALWNAFKDGRCCGLATKDSPQQNSDGVWNLGWLSHSVAAAATYVS